LLFRRFVQLFNRFGFNINRRRDVVNNRSIQNDQSLDLEGQIRPDFTRHSMSTQRYDRISIKYNSHK
jgi:hypothetical protein